MKTAHTKGNLYQDGMEITDKAMNLVASCFESEANAAELVKRWNMHEELVEGMMNACNTLYALRDHAQMNDMDGAAEQKAINNIIKLLNRAKQGGSND